MTWQTLGSIAPRALVPARLQLHWAAQVLGAAADGYVAPVPDDSHTAMAWQSGTLVGKAGVSLQVATLELVVGDAAFSLDGKTLADALAWTDAQLAAPASSPRGIHARDYDMPDHPVGRGAPFALAPIADALVELGRYYTNALELLAPHAACSVWPHHFDLGGELALGGDREIGIGLSPGDAAYEEPYFYVTPYPVPLGRTLPPLVAGGHWSTRFTGAVLPNLALVGEAGARAFLDSAIAASCEIVGAS
ncbi:MAG TPA: hypothetical protein VGL61_11510 [Kofleriaceae bacterium]|jgi:hypothetical protein